MTDLARAVAALVAALETVPEGGDPHVRNRTDRDGGVLLDLASGGTVWVGPAAAVGLPADRAGLPDPARVGPLARERARLDTAGEGYDLYMQATADWAAAELRGAAPTAVLALTDGGLAVIVTQPVDALWDAEEAGHVGEGFQDFVERNAAWAALGLTRPRGGWTVTIVDDQDDAEE